MNTLLGDGVFIFLANPDVQVATVAFSSIFTIMAVVFIIWKKVRR